LQLAFCAVRHYPYLHAATLLLLPFLGVSSLDLGPLVQTGGLLSFNGRFFLLNTSNFVWRPHQAPRFDFADHANVLKIQHPLILTFALLRNFSHESISALCSALRSTDALLGRFLP
jgi:hypothetical protein